MQPKKCWGGGGVPVIWNIILVKSINFFNSWGFLKRDFIYLFLETGEGREKERERNISVWLPLMCPTTGDLAQWLATQECALTGNRTSDPLVHRLVLSPLSHTSQG